ncbi:MAG: hypothetical protein ACT4QG_01535 [Sporichthyaceae bacterium]
MTMDLLTLLGTANVPNPAPIPPPGTEIIVGNWIGYFKWAALVAGTLGLIVCGMMMMVGRRHRSALASDGAAGVPWVIGGLVLVSLTSTIVATVLPG